MTADTGTPPLESPRALIEHRTIGPVPLDERTGSGKGLFGIWFGLNMVPLTVVTGSLATVVFGMPFWWSVVAIALGNVVGGVFMALHASQGPSLGVPQMLQARGQFGAKGASLIVVIATVMFVGFFISNLVVGAQSLNAVVSEIGPKLGIVLGVLASMAVTIVGLKLLMRLATISAIVIGALALATFIYLGVDGVPSGSLSNGTLTATGFFSMLAIGAVWQIAYAPYVSDYSRYLPADTGGRGAFWGTYGGSVLAASLLMTLGALLGVLSSDGDAITGLEETTGDLATVTLLAFALVSMFCNSGNIYCATLNALTFVETFKSGWLPAARGRLVTAAVLHMVGLVIALGASESFLTDFTNFILILLYVLIPWSAINLVDYFLIAHGDYDVDAFFRADGGRYGRWNVPALVVYAIGLAAQVPFWVLPQYIGPIAEELHHIDVAWVVGLVVSGALYYAVAKRTRVTVAPTRPAAAYVS